MLDVWGGGMMMVFPNIMEPRLYGVEPYGAESMVAFENGPISIDKVDNFVDGAWEELEI